MASIDQFPTSSEDDEEKKSPEIEEDDDDDDEEEDDRSEESSDENEKSRSLGSWLRGFQETEQSDEEAEDEKSSFTYEIGSIFGAALEDDEEAVEVQKSNDSSELDYDGSQQNLGDQSFEPGGESAPDSEEFEPTLEDQEEPAVESAEVSVDEEQTVVFERRDVNDSEEVAAEVMPEADPEIAPAEEEPSDALAVSVVESASTEPESTSLIPEEEPSEEEAEVVVSAESGSSAEEESSIEEPSLPIDVEEPEEPARTRTYYSRDSGGAYTTPAATERTTVINNTEIIENRYGGGISLADILIYRNASKKIKAQGKKIEQLRRVDNQQQKEIDRLDLENREQRARMINQQPVKAPETSPKTPELTKAELSTPVSELNKKQAVKAEAIKTPPEQTPVRTEVSARADATKSQVRAENSPAFSSGNESVLQTRKIEEISTAEKFTRDILAPKQESTLERQKQDQEELRLERERIQAEMQAQVERAKESNLPNEVKYDQSHEIKHYSAVPVSEIVENSQTKKVINELIAEHSNLGPKASVSSSDAAAKKPVRLLDDKTNVSYLQAAAAGITAAVVLMAIVFILFALR